MKKLFLSFLLLGGLVPAAQAQGSVVGLRAGVNLSAYAGPNSGGATTLSGGLAGLIVTSTFDPSAMVTLELEFLYSGKGTNATDSGLELTQRLHYLDMPVLLQVRPQQFELEVGPQFGFLLAQSTKLSDNKGNQASGTGTGGFKSFQAGYILGVGYRLPDGFGFGIRYNGSFSEIGSGTGLRNSTFQMQLSYLLRALRPQPMPVGL